MYSIEVEQSPAYELIISFYTFVYFKNLKGNELGIDWYNETKASLPKELIEMIEDERWEVLHRLVLLVHQCPNKETVEDFLTWFSRLAPGEIYERMAPWVDTMPLNLKEIRDKSVCLLSDWNEYYFKRIDSCITEALAQEVEVRKNQLAKMTPETFIEKLTEGLVIDPTDHLKKVIIVPQYHARPSVILDFFGGMATCLYPLNIKQETELEPNDTILPMAQCLADEKRLRILSYLAEKPRTLIEIHKHLSIAKSTAHHHLAILRRAGLIRSHYLNSSTVAYYSIRQGFTSLFYHELKSLVKES